MPALATATERADEERRRAVRLLLRSPLVRPHDPDPVGFILVRRHAEPVGRWFREQLGWTLVVDPRGRFARLHKRVAAAADPTHPAVAPGRERPFDVRRYVLFCVTSAELDASGAQQTILSRLADGVRARTQVEAAIDTFEPTVYAERKAFIDVLAMLEGLGVLTLREGDAERYFSGVAEDDAFYDIDRGLLGHLVAVGGTKIPSQAGGADELLDEPYPPTERGRQARDRHAVMRRLVDEPAVYEEDLGEGERIHLLQRRGLEDELMAWTGMVLERRAEGIAAIDEADELVDRIHFPGEGVRPHAALLVAEWLAERLRVATDPILVVPVAEIEALVAELIEEHRAHWPPTYLARTDLVEVLTADALAILVAYRLVRFTPSGVRPMPAIARFRAVAVPERAGVGEQLGLTFPDPEATPS